MEKMLIRIVIFIIKTIIAAKNRVGYVNRISPLHVVQRSILSLHILRTFLIAVDHFSLFFFSCFGALHLNNLISTTFTLSTFCFLVIQQTEVKAKLVLLLYKF